MSDFVEQPIKALMNENNPIGRIERVEELTGASPSASVNSLDEVANDIGIFGGGSNELILTPEGVEAVLPTSTDFTGTFVSGDGYSFNSETYNIGGVNAGVLQWGAKQSDGKMIAGASAVVIDENGITFEEGTTAANRIKWVDSSSNEIHKIDTETTVNSIISTHIITGTTSKPNAAIRMDVNADNGAGDASFVVNVLDNSFSSNARIALYSLAKTFEHYGNLSLYNQLSAKAGTPNVLNEAGEDIDTRIEGDTATSLLVVDAGLDAVQIGTTTAADIMDARGGSVVFNENSRDMDFRVESNGVANMLFIDGGADTIALNNVDVTPATSTFSPTVTGSATAGTGTYTDQYGVYFKIGSMVMYQIDLTWTAHTGTGNLQISGLPFTTANNGMNSNASVYWSNLTLTAAGSKVIARIAPNSTVVVVAEITNGAAAALPLDTAGTLRLNGWYLAA